MTIPKPSPDAVQLEAYQARVMEEYGDLDRRVTSLVAFLNGPKFPELPEEDQRLLKAQHKAMQEYGGILATRIMKFLNAA